MHAPTPGSLNDDLSTRIEQAIEQLEEAKRDLTSLPPGAAVERIMDRLGLLAFSAVHPDGGASSRAGSLIRLLALIRSHAARGWNWGRIVEDLRELIDDSDYKVEGMTLEMGREDVVRIMNVHQAKGLQAPVVFLADSRDTSYQQEPRSHVARSGNRAYLSMIVTKPKGENGSEVVAQPEGWENDRDEEERFAAAEEVRLLYVAATRARDLLVVSTYEERPESGPWSPLYQFLSDVPELPVFRPAEKASTRDEESTFGHMRHAAAVRVAQSKEATHSVRTVSGVDAEAEFAPADRGGRGRDYGVIIHQLFEEAVSGRLPADLETYVRGLTMDAGLTDSLAADALGALQRFQTSTLLRDVRKSKRVFTEVPLCASEHREESIYAVRGIIDLIYKEDDRWRIVDYKTDLATTEAELERLRRRYTPQIQDYAKYWTLVTGEAAECGFWFVHGPSRENQLALF